MPSCDVPIREGRALDVMARRRRPTTRIVDDIRSFLPQDLHHPGQYPDEGVHRRSRSARITQARTFLLKRFESTAHPLRLSARRLPAIRPRPVASIASISGPFPPTYVEGGCADCRRRRSDRCGRGVALRRAPGRRRIRDASRLDQLLYSGANLPPAARARPVSLATAVGLTLRNSAHCFSETPWRFVVAQHPGRPRPRSPLLHRPGASMPLRAAARSALAGSPRRSLDGVGAPTLVVAARSLSRSTQQRRPGCIRFRLEMAAC